MNENLAGIPWENLSPQEACSELEVDPHSGLSDSEARARLLRWGKNRIAQKGRPSGLAIFLRQFQSAVVLLLLLATIVAAGLGQTLDAAAIFAALLLNALIGFLTEYQASASLQSLKNLALL
ncbi:MAG TPA: cation-transporting P-type ATPase, partial [Chroococcales cyanobacterium]